jgi:DNA-binding GntR family transcriptional regulator
MYQKEMKPIKTLNVKTEEMRQSTDRIPNEVLKEIFPTKLKRSLVSEQVFSHLKRMILSGELKKGQKLLQDEMAQAFNVSKLAVAIAFSRLRKDRLVITKRRVGTFVV